MLISFINSVVLPRERRVKMLKKPLLIVPTILKGGHIRFLLPNKEIELESEITEIAWSILGMCNGKVSIGSITRQLAEIDDTYIIGFLSDLEYLGVIADSRSVYKHFHAVCSNPATYPSDITDEEALMHARSPRMPIKKGRQIKLAPSSVSRLVRLQRCRFSCRNFSGKPLKLSELGNVLDIGYSLERHAVPSAGGLYPMKLFVIALNDQIDFPAGYYEYDNESDCLVLFNDNPDVQRISHVFNSIGLPFNASVLLVIAADADRQPYKYSNLGYRFMAIEAGEISQNISLGAVEAGLATCMLGGVRDNELTNELQLIGCLPFVSIALGESVAVNPTLVAPSSLDCLEAELVGSDKPVQRTWLVDDTFSNNFDKSYFQVLADTQNNQVASGISTSWFEAKNKAIAEGFERQCSSNVRYDICSTARDLPNAWLDPRVVAPLTNEQYEKLPHLQNFTENTELEWIKGVDMQGKSVFVPIDLVFYPINGIHRKLIVDTCSSGFAAHVSYEEAVNLGMLELVERDSLMRYWFEERSPRKLSRRILPTHLRNRAEYWDRLGYNVSVLDVSQRGVVVIEVIITSDNYPCFVSGASSTTDALEASLIKAFQEAESRLICRLNETEVQRIEPNSVYSVLDHELLYAQSKAYHEHVRFLLEGDESSIMPTATTSVNELRNKLKIVVVDVSNQRYPTLKTVKVLSPELIPISFGFGAGYYSHHSIENVAFAKRFMPHYFA